MPGHKLTMAVTPGHPTLSNLQTLPLFTMSAVTCSLPHSAVRHPTIDSEGVAKLPTHPSPPNLWTPSSLHTPP